MIKKTLCIVCLLSGGSMFAMTSSGSSADVTKTVTVTTYEQQMKELDDIQVELYLDKELSESDAASFSRLLRADIKTAGVGDAYGSLMLAIVTERERIATAEAESIQGAPAPTTTSSVPAFSGTSRRVGSVVDQASGTISQLKAQLATAKQELTAEREEKARRLASSQTQLRTLAAKLTELSSVNAQMRVQMAHDAQARVELERLIKEQCATIEQQTKELQDADTRLGQLETLLKD